MTDVRADIADLRIWGEDETATKANDIQIIVTKAVQETLDYLEDANFTASGRMRHLLATAPADRTLIRRVRLIMSRAFPQELGQFLTRQEYYGAALARHTVSLFLRVQANRASNQPRVALNRARM